MIVFGADQPLGSGVQCEISIAWPVLLEANIGLQLVLPSVITRSEGHVVMGRFYKYEFRTRGPRDYQLQKKENFLYGEVDAGLGLSAQNVYTEYVDKSRDEWTTVTVPALREVPLPVLQKISGLSRQMLMKARAGTTRPLPKNRERLAAILKELKLLGRNSDS